MSVAPVKKLSLVGRKADRDCALARLQDLGVMHLLPVSPVETHPEKVVGRAAEDAYRALRFLSVVPNPRRQVRRDPTFDVHAFVQEILKLRDDLRQARDKRDFLANRIATLRPWGDFSFPPKEAMGDLRLWFYKLPLKQRESLRGVDLPWQIVGQDHKFAYVVILATTEPPADILPVPRQRTGAKPIAILEIALDETEILIESLQATRMAQTRFLTLLRAS
ncbi:MAG: V-type ATP synthase subunit I, partial [Pseudomonadota bacterium]